MKCTVNGTDYVMVGFSEYLDQFEMQVVPEFKGKAEELFLIELDKMPEDGEVIMVYLEAERTKWKENLVFPFGCYSSEYSGVLELLFLGYRVEE